MDAQTMTKTGPALAQPLTLSPSCVLKNRLAKSAMSENMAGPGGAPTAAFATLYRRWAEGGAGLLFTGNVMIDAGALGEPDNVVVEDDRHLDALKRWAEAGRTGGAQIWMQLNHPGRQAPKGLNAETLSASAVPFAPEMEAMFAPPRAATAEEILAIIGRFAASAEIAKRAGFNGVQIHGAHGYLVSQFLSPHTNRRDDDWGGDPARRRRFVLEILKAIRDKVGADFPVGIKLNSADFQRGGFSQEEGLDAVRALAEAGIDLIEISGGTYEAPAMVGARKVRESTLAREAYFLDFARDARAAVKTPLMLTGGFRSFGGMQAALASGAIDLVGLARPLAVEPDAPLRLLRGEDPVHPVRPITTGVKAIDKMGMLEITWYARQLQRMGRGKAPDLGESPLKVFALNLLSSLRLMLAGKKPISRVRA